MHTNLLQRGKTYMKMRKAISAVLVFCLLLAFVPAVKVSAATTTWTANKVNVDSYTDKDAILFTADFGKDVLPAAAYRDYSWWRVIVCDYDFGEGVYKVISVNTTTGTGMSKTAVIPKNGFVIADCYSSSFDGLVNVKVGDTAYLYMGSTTKVTFGGKGSGTPHAPEGKGISMPKTNLNHMGITAAGKNGFTLKINDYDKNTGYYLVINDSSVCDDGVIKQSTKKLTSDTYVIPKTLFNNSSMLTVSLWAKKGNEYSPVVRTKMVLFEDSAFMSQLSEKTVVAFGDSLTAFTGWVKSMLTVIGTDVINSGVGGDTSTQGRNRFKRDVLDKNPDVCIINFGMNDQAEVIATGKPNNPLDTFTANIRYFIEELQKIDCYVVLVTPHTPHKAENYYSSGQYGLDYTGKHLETFRNTVRNLAEEYGCGLVDIGELSKNENMAAFTMMYDGLHCSEYGHSKYLQWISEFLLEKFATAGDADGNGVTDERDLDAIKENLGNTDDTLNSADVNRNGYLDANDYLSVKRYTAGNGELKWNKNK